MVLPRILRSLSGPWCEALDLDGNPSCWQTIEPDQPGRLCDDCWHLLATDGSPQQRLDLAREANIPPPILDVLVTDPSAMVRATLADNPVALLTEHLDALAHPSQPRQVLRRMARREDLEDRHVHALMASGDEAALLIVAANPRVAADLRAQAQSHPAVAG